MSLQLTNINSDSLQTNDFLSIILNKTPLIDVRAPTEFAQGAFGSATNIALMNDKERQEVGLCYKQKGNKAAVKLGYRLVNQRIRVPRIASWIEFMVQNPQALLYCFRGGMRSKISQQWLQESGHSIVRLNGGYKAFRCYLIDYMNSVPEVFTQQGIQPVVLAGRTGSGKTLVINQLTNAIDLEGLAYHRGSTFGYHATPQPTQINFENELSASLIRFAKAQSQSHSSFLILEDEGHNIGSVNIPLAFFEFFKSGVRVVVETTLEVRIEITLDEYVIQAQKEYSTLGDWLNVMEAAFLRIKKRLGGERYQRIILLFNSAIEEQIKLGSTEHHQAWIKLLLLEYYDPMYDYQMQKGNYSELFKGNISEVIEFIRSY